MVKTSAMRVLIRTFPAIVLIAVVEPISSWAYSPMPARLVREVDGSPQFAGVVNGLVLFFTDDEEHGRELWRSDGTAEGTRIVRDIWPGPAWGAYYVESVVFEDRLVFTAWNEEGDSQLWRSDGTEAGTMLMRNIYPGFTASPPRLFTPVGDRLWFMVANGFRSDERGSDELWATDSTTEGTVRISELGFWEPGFSGGSFAVHSLTPFKDGALASRIDIFECCEETSLRWVDAKGQPAAPLYAGGW